jgi:hypothetical protein
MYCSNCGTEISYRGNFCESCGSRLPDQAIVEIAATQPQFEKEQLVKETGTNVPANESSGPTSSAKHFSNPAGIFSTDVVLNFLKPVAYIGYSLLLAAILIVLYEDLVGPFQESSSSQYIFAILFTLLVASITHAKCESFKQATKYHLFTASALFFLGVILELAKDNPNSDNQTATETVQEKSEIFGSRNSDRLTPQQRNAANQAIMYSNSLPMGFSRSGLIQQLIHPAEGYELSDATIAVDSLRIDYNEQAAKTARNYINSKVANFSCNRLIQQLMDGDSFTKEQATNGARASGACD